MVLKALRFWTIATASAVAFVTLTTGCSNLFGPKPEEAKPFEKKNDAACVKDVPKNLQAWLHDGSADIARSVDCTVAAIDDFSRHVVGRTKNVYTVGELNEFINEYLTPDDSPDAGNVREKTDEILKVKQVLLGGTSDLVTRDELARLKSILLRSRPLLVQLSPNIKTLLFNASSATSAEVTSASNSLKSLLDLFAQEFDHAEPGRPEYGFSDFLNSAHRLGLKNDSVATWLPLAESVKVLVLSGDPDALRARDWAPMIRTIAEVWGLALRAKYNLQGNPEILRNDFAMMESTARQIIDIFGRAVAAHGGSIPTSEFEKVIDAVAGKNGMPSLKGRVVGAQTLKDFLPKIFGKLLYGRWNNDFDRASQQFGTAQLARLTQIVDDWIAGQNLINLSLNGHDEFSFAAFGKSLAAKQVVRKGFVDDTTYAMAVRAQKQLLQFVTQGRPLIHDTDGRLIVLPREQLPDMHRSDLNLLNAARAVITGLLTGWTHDPLSAQGISGLTDTEVQELYLDLRSLGKDLNFIDVRSNQAGTRTFMENAVFMSTSDGNPYMGLQEGVEWFNFVTSGSTVADQFYAQMAKVCAVGKIDVLGNQKLDATCFRREFLRSWTQQMPNLPHLISWVMQDGSGQRATAMEQALENAGRNRGYSNEYVDSSEFRSMMPILHYQESIFARFDVNHNDLLDDDEISNAFPLLAPFIKKMGNGNADSEGMQRAILSYIIEFGTVPSTDLGGMLKMGGWYVVHKLFSQSADRNKVLGIIGAFPAANKMTRVSNIKAYFDANKASLRALIRVREKTNALKLADLFQCLPEAAPQFGADLAVNLDLLVPTDGSVDSDTFTARVKAMMDKDSRLEPVCLPF